MSSAGALCAIATPPATDAHQALVQPTFWTRVPSPVRHDPNAFRIYAADDDILDVIMVDDLYGWPRRVVGRTHR